MQQSYQVDVLYAFEFEFFWFFLPKPVFTNIWHLASVHLEARLPLKKCFYILKYNKHYLLFTFEDIPIGRLCQV